MKPGWVEITWSIFRIIVASTDVSAVSLVCFSTNSALSSRNQPWGWLQINVCSLVVKCRLTAIDFMELMNFTIISGKLRIHVIMNGGFLHFSWGWEQSGELYFTSSTKTKKQMWCLVPSQIAQSVKDLFQAHIKVMLWFYINIIFSMKAFYFYFQAKRIASPPLQEEKVWLLCKNICICLCYGQQDSCIHVCLSLTYRSTYYWLISCKK